MAPSTITVSPIPTVLERLLRNVPRNLTAWTLAMPNLEGEVNPP
jgi:hypothetical protein